MNTDIQKLLKKNLMSEETAQEYIKRREAETSIELEQAKKRLNDLMEKIKNDLQAMPKEQAEKVFYDLQNSIIEDRNKILERMEK
ncbi:hypothetical protein [Bizionia paragorgiae]|uniref:hypothetical protein n=1 Tax=Bizionia paragorgiae TaxID=283786 RepID=UPI003A9185CF